MAQVTIHVPPRPYQARIENGLLARAGSLLAELLPQASKLFVVTVAAGSPSLGREAASLAGLRRIQTPSSPDA